MTRALLLWPRLDRRRLSKCGNDPVRIAEVVRRRTSQPFDAILAMLVRHAESLAPKPPTAASSIEPAERGRLRLLRNLRLRRVDESDEDEADACEIEGLRPA